MMAGVEVVSWLMYGIELGAVDLFINVPQSLAVACDLRSGCSPT